MRQVIGIGETILDLVFQGNRPHRAVPGGSTFNGMVSLARCGIPVLFISELGQDAVGRLIRSFMEENHLSTECIDFFENGQSPVSMAFLDENRNASYSFYMNFPQQRLNVSFPPVAENDVLIFGSYFAVHPVLRPKVREWLAYAREQRAIVYYDINFRKAHAAERDKLMPYFVENFRFATLVRCSDEDLETLFPGQTFEAIYERCFLPEKKSLIVTRGTKAVWLKTPSLEKYYPVDVVTPISTIGAGDNFNAGLVYGILKHSISYASFGYLTENQWNKLIVPAQQFAREVCLSMENYVSGEFVRRHRL